MVKAKSGSDLQLSVTVYDMQGRTVVAEDIRLQQGSTQFATNVKSLMPGNYLLSIKDKNAELWHAKFVKQ